MSMPTHRHRRSRRRHTVFFDLADTADNRFDLLIESLLMTLIVFGPLALGAVQAWSELVVVVIAAAMAMCLAIKLLSRPQVRFVWSWTYLPMAAFLALVAIQLLPLPAALVRVVSPNAFELRQSLLAAVPESARHLDTMTLSLYPEATLHDLRLLLAIAAVYVVTLNAIRQSRQIRRVLIAISLSGAAVAVIGLVHLAGGVDRIYGLIDVPRRDWPIAPFINGNHFGQFMNLSLGAAAALLLTQAGNIIGRRRRSAMGVDDMLVNVPRMTWLLAGAAAMGVGLFMSLSRGAIVTMAVSAGAAMLVGRRHGLRTRVWAMLPVAWVVLMVVVYFGYDLVAGRFAAAGNLDSHSFGGRVRMVGDVLHAARQFPLVGAGMGTFQVLYPMYDSSTWTSLATHAENEYAQTLLEAGALGLGLIIAFVAMIGTHYVRCLKSAPSPMASTAVGLGMGLGAVLLQSFMDFGQHIPANAVLAAVACALLVTLAEAGRQTHADEPQPKQHGRPLRAVGVALAGCAMAWAGADALGAARAEQSWNTVRKVDATLRARYWQGADNDYAQLLIAAMRARDLRRGDIRYHYWLNYYRWKSISRESDPKTGMLLMTPQQIEWAARIADELIDNAWRCPTYGASYSLAGQVASKILDRPDAGGLIRTGYRLSQNDPAANFEAGLLDARQSNWDDAMGKFAHAAALAEPYRIDGVEALAGDLRRADLAIKLAGDSVPALRRVVAILQRAGDGRAAESSRQLAELIRQQAGPADAPAAALIEAARQATSENDHAGAIGYYTRALHAEPGSAEWRLELARALAAAGRMDDAITEARLAQRMGAANAQNVILELRRQPATVPAPLQ